MQRRNYETHASEQELEQAPDPLEEDPGLVERIDCPALVAAGEEDMVDFRNAVPELAAKLPQATTTTIADCGHLAPMEAPRGVSPARPRVPRSQPIATRARRHARTGIESV